MAKLKVQDINDPLFIREVEAGSWKHWPKGKSVLDGRMSGNRTLVPISEEQEAAAKERATRPNTPRIPLPATVEQVMGNKTPMKVGEKIALIKEAKTEEEVDKIVGDDVRPGVVNAATERKAELQ